MSTRAQQIDILLSGLMDPDNNAVLSGGTVEFYAAGTDTPKNVWSEKEKTNAYTSITLDSNGSVANPYYGDGWYKIIVKDADGNTEYTWPFIYLQSNAFSVVQKTEAYTATPDDDVVLCNGTFTVTIGSATYPTPSYFAQPLVFKNIGSGSITLDPYSTVTIDGSSTVTLVPNDVITIYPDGTSNTWRRNRPLTDLDGQELILDADGDTSITADTDDQIDVKINGADEYIITASAFDFNANELILDADADTSITADTDDQIDFKLGGNDWFKIFLLAGTTRCIEPTTDNSLWIGSTNDKGLGGIITHTIYMNNGTSWISQGKDVTVPIHRKIIEIGDWDMDSTGTKAVAHGLTLSKIRKVSATLRNDADNGYYELPFVQIDGNPQAFLQGTTASDINLARLAGGSFDTTSFDSTSYNRGWIIVEYVD